MNIKLVSALMALFIMCKQFSFARQVVAITQPQKVTTIKPVKKERVSNTLKRDKQDTRKDKTAKIKQVEQKIAQQEAELERLHRQKNQVIQESQIVEVKATTTVTAQKPTYYCKTHDPRFAGPVSCAPPLKNYNHWFFPPVLYSQYAHPEYFMEYPWYGYGPRYGGAYW